MPRRRSYARRPKRRFRRRRVYKRKTQKTINFRSGTVIAPRYITRLKYSGIISTGSIASGGFVDYQFRLNSIFDPDFTSVGHQPMGHDQLQQLYSRYRVFSASVIVTYPPIANNTNAWACIVPTNNSTAITYFDEAKELQRSRWRALSTTNATSLRMRVNLPNLGGVTSVQYKGDDRYQAQFGASPTELYQLHICTFNTSGSSQAYAPNVQIIYHTECFDPVQLVQS